MPIKQSLCFPMYLKPELSLDDLCREVKAIGYAAVEYWFRSDDWRSWVETAAKHDLKIASMCGHNSLTDGLNDPANHDRIEAEIRESIDLAVECGIPGLICFTGNRRPGLSEEEGLAITAAGLKRVAPYAEEKGINLNLELLNSKVDHPGYQADHTAWGVEVCKATGSSRVKLLYDIYHMQIMEGDIIRTIQDNLQYIGHFHTAGNPGRQDMDDEQELNYRGICNAISASGYDLYLAHEFKPKVDPVASLRTAFEICNV